MVNVHALVATGVNGDGHREILGLQAAATSASTSSPAAACGRSPTPAKPLRR